MTLRSKIILLFALLIAAAGIAVWFYRGHQEEQRKANAKAAEEERIRSVVANVKNSWSANDEWENDFSAPNAPIIPYTLEVENALVKGRPLIFYGIVEDVHAYGDQDSSIVMIRVLGKTNRLNLRLSLKANINTIDPILHDKHRIFDTFIIAATIASVENVQVPPDKYDNDQGYFLAHGILHEAQPIGIYFPHKK
jgi:hypothetical protein